MSDGNTGVWIEASSLTMTDVTVTASGAPNNTGVVSQSSNPTLSQSKVSGSTNSLFLTGSPSYITRVALTQLVGPVFRTSPTLQCFNNYDGTLASVICP
jgi:hypothetical protein